ncbi:7766_t:CDS:2 [Scutellospora calospora]|uniref:7766_t:CDS:1 n=1 Tax=Scutellospora calospora TaxID=85575 RepID=A0ACA9MY54_9GLOM|nr:7766_t:CDS:2 [Scutellospora calospora]
MVRDKGLEPLRFKAPDPKSGASTIPPAPFDFFSKSKEINEILREELLIPLNISPEELAKEIKVSKEQIK